MADGTVVLHSLLACHISYLLGRIVPKQHMVAPCSMTRMQQASEPKGWLKGASAGTDLISPINAHMVASMIHLLHSKAMGPYSES